MERSIGSINVEISFCIGSQYHGSVISRKEELAFAIECYFRCGESVKCVEREFRKRFAIPPRGRIPHRAIILLLYIPSVD